MPRTIAETGGDAIGHRSISGGKRDEMELLVRGIKAGTQPLGALCEHISDAKRRAGFVPDNHDERRRAEEIVEELELVVRRL